MVACRISRPTQTGRAILSKTTIRRRNQPITNGDGPGLTGLKLSRVKELLGDLGTDNALPPQKRADLRAFYTHEQNRLKLQLVVLGNAERVKSCEDALQEAGKALDFARSDDGRQDARRKWQTRIGSDALGAGGENLSGPSSSTGTPEEKEIRRAESQHSLVEATLAKARSELQKASAELERLSRGDGKWKEAESAAKRWELSRKWEAITPEELRPAVEAIRHTFEHRWCWQSEQSTMKLCFAALHPESPDDARAAYIEFAKQRSAAPRQEDSDRGIPTRSTPPVVAGTQPPDVWRNLHEIFRALAEEELRLAPHNTGDRWLRAYVDYKETYTPHYTPR